MHKSSFVLTKVISLVGLMLVACASGAAPTPVSETRLAASRAVTPTLTVAPNSSPTVPPAPNLPTETTTPALPSSPAGAPSAQPTEGNTRSGLTPITRNPQELRAAWVHDNSIMSAEKIDEMIRRAMEGHINVIVANVYSQGMTLYDSSLVSKHPQVQSDFNPLPYLVEQAHRRGIQVHAWFVNGPVDYKGKSSIIDKHPDWALVGPDDQKMAWMNVARPDVRQFISDLMWETVARYGVDGVFFDYTRYPGPQWGFDPYTISAFNSTHDFDVEELRYASLPAYGHFEGNTLVQPGTAQVLAAFDDGTPAVILNKYGQGQVIVLNWKASEREISAGSEIMRRSIKFLLKEGGQVSSLRPEGTLDANAKGSLQSTADWLIDLGWQAAEIAPKQIKDMNSSSVLIVSYGFSISPAAASDLSSFVARGGGVIFIDGPVRSIEVAEIRALTGMEKRGKGFEKWTLLLPRGDHPLIPTSASPVTLATAQARDAQWKDFRKRGVDLLIQDVYKRIKAQYPQVEVSATVTSDQATASQMTLQDWQAWLEGGYIDFLVPRGYVEDVDELDLILAAWQPAIRKYRRVTLGVSTFSGKHNPRIPKSPAQLQAEIRRARAAGSYGIMLWNLDYISEDQLKKIAADAFR